jgi:hypothetical protein
MTLKETILKATREVVTRTLGYPQNRAIDESRVQYFNADANDFVYRNIQNALNNGTGYALCKLGTVELGCIVSYLKQRNWQMSDYCKFVRGYPVPLFYGNEIKRLNNNAGVFPAVRQIADRFCSLMVATLTDVDTIASYAWCERYIANLIAHCSTVNLDGYYAPFLYRHPWTRILEGKKVLIIHPFTESIEQQYAKRELLFDNQEVMPKFQSLQVIKAVQSIAGNDCGFKDWFDALDFMKQEMRKVDFDIALIGCGAYGFPLTVHAKRLGKVGIHLAGWTQMLFGIYGKRWLTDQPQYAHFINKYWIRPGQSEVPNGAGKVEGGCYW